MSKQNAILKQSATSPSINKTNHIKKKSQKKHKKKTTTTSYSCCHHQASPTKQNTKRKGVPKDISKQNTTLEQSTMMEAFWGGSIMRRNVKAKPPSKVQWHQMKLKRSIGLL
jgi:hypothetical protein